MTAPPVHGLDIHGAYQPVSDWSAIPPFPLMSCKGTEGKQARQKNGQAYFANFRERPFRYRGMYHWLRSDSTPKEQFENVKRWWAEMGGMQQGEFNQTDWEVTPGIADPTVAQVLEFNDRCQQEWPGRLLVYVSDWVSGFHEWLSHDPVEPIWYANYNLSDKPTGGKAETEMYHAALWQFTSKYVCPGIDTVCDANTILRLDAVERAAGYPKATPAPPIPPTPAHLEHDMDYLTNSEQRTAVNDGQSYGAGIIKFAIMEDGRIREVTREEGIGRALSPATGTPTDNATLDAWPKYTVPTAGPTSVFSATGTWSGTMTPQQ